jgi:hypothetical protein
MRNSLFALALASAFAAPAQALTTGDLAFTAFNADEDGWAMVTFVDLAPNTHIYFSDNEFGGAVFNSGESAHLWNTGAGAIAAGSVIRFSAIDSVPSASFGSLSIVDNANLGLSATSETIYAYLGASHTAPSVFLAGISSEGTTNLAPAGLTAGVTAVVLTSSTDYAEYSGARLGQVTFSAYAPLVNDAGNWNIVVGGDNSLMVPDTTVFAVPEPETYAMMLAGLGLLGLVARRRRA